MAVRTDEFTLGHLIKDGSLGFRPGDEFRDSSALGGSVEMVKIHRARMKQTSAVHTWVALQPVNELLEGIDLPAT
jgi:hypothetical protein